MIALSIFICSMTKHIKVWAARTKKILPVKQSQSRIIDGDDGKCPIPVVVGISATPKRFTAAMEGRSERIPYPVVKVSPADVQASGLLKDKIVLQAPTEGAAVYNIYLNDACKTLGAVDGTMADVLRTKRCADG